MEPVDAVFATLHFQIFSCSSPGEVYISFALMEKRPGLVLFPRLTTLDGMQLYAITNSLDSSSSFMTRRDSLCHLASSLAEGGVDYLQVREKDLSSQQLELLTAALLKEVEGSRTKVLLNGAVDIAVALGASGVHLPGDSCFGVQEVRQRYESQGNPKPIVSVACHSSQEVVKAKAAGATFALYAPIFGKRTPEGTLPGIGLAALQQTCRSVAPFPVFALGGITQSNAFSCLEAGATGVAAIRLFEGSAWRKLKEKEQPSPRC